MRKILLLLFSGMFSLGIHAQSVDSVGLLRKFVVADMETRVPIRDVRVITNTGYRDTTNYRGVCYLPAKFDTVIVYKANYLSEKLAFKEVKDSTYLLAKNHQLKEVTVWGHDRQKELDDNVRAWGAAAAAQGDAEAQKGLFSFDVANMLDRRGRRDKKHLRKTREAFSKMDSKGKRNPVEAAYKDDKEAERIASERQKALQEAALKKEKMKEENNQELVNDYMKLGNAQTATVQETAAQVDTLRSKLLDGISEDLEANGENRSYRHTYYYKATSDSLQAALSGGQMRLLSAEQSYPYVTVDLGKQWSTEVKNIIDKQLSAAERTKLAEQENTLIVQLHLSQGGKVLLAKLRFMDPYQGVTTLTDIRSILSDLQSARLEGLDTVPATDCFIMSFTYHD